MLPKHSLNKKSLLKISGMALYFAALTVICVNFSLSGQTKGGVSKITAASADNFAYPQSVFADSKNGNLWVADFDNNRVLRFDISGLTGVKEEAGQSPSGFYLGQNYPNPFNPATTINFSTKTTGHTILSVYNLLGQKIAVLFNETAAANTVYSIRFDAKPLPSGIYMYSLRTPGGTEIKKMCLMK